MDIGWKFKGYDLRIRFFRLHISSGFDLQTTLCFPLELLWRWQIGRSERWISFFVWSYGDSQCMMLSFFILHVQRSKEKTNEGDSSGKKGIEQLI